MIFSANYFGMDEDKGTVDGEKTLDRIAVVPFGEWSDMSVNDFAAKQKKFKTIVDDLTNSIMSILVWIKGQILNFHLPKNLLALLTTPLSLLTS